MLQDVNQLVSQYWQFLPMEIEETVNQTISDSMVRFFTQFFFKECKGHSGRDRMAVGFITFYAISAYHH